MDRLEIDYHTYRLLPNEPAWINRWEVLALVRSKVMIGKHGVRRRLLWCYGR